MRDSQGRYGSRSDRPNMGRYRRLLDLHSLPDVDRRLDPARHDRALVCLADPAARMILRRLAQAPAAEKELQSEAVRDREKLALRLYRLLSLDLIKVVGRDPNVFALHRDTLAEILTRLAAEFGPLPEQDPASGGTSPAA